MHNSMIVTTMMSNYKFAYMCLLTLVSLCNGENCQAKYRITPTCAAQYYGTISRRYLGIRSVTECANICNNEESCRSVIYNYKTEKCRTYSFHLDNLTNNCTEMVKYVALDTFEGFCFTSRVAETTTSPPRGIFDPCSINTDCGGIGAAECRHDMCQCVPLLSYEPTSNKCVAECITYGTTFQEDLYRYLGSINADKTQIKPTAGHCKDSCVNESLFKCRAAEYISYDNKCRLHSEDSLKSKTVDYQTSNDFDLYIRDCAYTNTVTFSSTTQQSNIKGITKPPTAFPPGTIPQTQTPTSLPPTTQSSIYSSCINDIDCDGIFDAECRYGQCQCLPGLSHDPISNSCVQECATYGTTFNDLQGHYLSYASDDKIGGVSDPLHCMHLCIEKTSYVCRVAELYYPNSYCLLYSEETFITNDLTLKPSVSYDHYMRDCAAPLSTTSKTSASPSFIFMSCTDNTVCAEISDAECRDGKCQCIPGLSHNPVSNSCVKECMTYGTTFQEFQDHYLDVFSPDWVEYLLDPVVCMDACIAQTSSVCVVAEVWHPYGECMLYSHEQLKAINLAFTPSERYDHYMRDCAVEPSTTPSPLPTPSTPTYTTYPPPQTSTLPSYISMSCIDDTDCIGNFNFKCRHEICRCLPGLSYDPISNGCVQECATYGTTFQELQDNYLSFNSDDMIGGITDPVECMNLCIAESSYLCRVAELYYPNSYCLLYSEETFNAYMYDLTFNPSVSYDHYTRDCAVDHPPTTSPSTSPPLMSPNTPPSTTYPPIEMSTPLSYIFSACMDNTDCEGISDAECRYEICQCIPGLSHDPVSNSCVQECATYGTTFQELQASYLGFNVDHIILSTPDPDECMNWCIAEPSFVCRAAELYYPNSHCRLYSVETVAANTVTFNPSASYDLYMRDCATE